ncbi:uncharacterized protein LOC114017021 isoform X1 [Falco cherrug]|uniref:uncharacterized protein LOC114017021 isoform X1 n=1 Tax=Falco cherrug TaxID=345164 RepID=UPI00247ADB0C|nr:uncharacterized protein LOC114017021 isoform X1 [Falco cherrug]
MRRNVEVKARLRALAAARGAAERLGGAARAQGQGQAQGQGLVQADTFFRVPRGRLKLRRTPDGRGELIFYERPDTAGPKLSHFTITPTDDPDGLEAVLTQALGVLGVVRKERLLYLVGQTRVHLDSVEGLGDFVELEVVLTEEQTVEDGERVAHQLMKELGIEEEDLISGAYLDLLLAKGDSSS